MTANIIMGSTVGKIPTIQNMFGPLLIGYKNANPATRYNKYQGRR